MKLQNHSVKLPFVSRCLVVFLPTKRSAEPVHTSLFHKIAFDRHIRLLHGVLSRYSRKEPFLYLNVDIRNANSLNDALTEYVRGELLEGGDAYMCETCNAKVDAVKRISIEKLPKILAIQLKRFDYDWERCVDGSLV